MTRPRPSRLRKTANRRRLALRERLPSWPTVWSTTRRWARLAMPAAVVLSSAMVVASVLVLCFLWVTESATFAIETVRVSGVERLRTEEIHRRLELPAGANIFTTDMDELADRLRAHPWIAEVEITRSLPDEIRIEVTERRVAAAVELGGLYLVDHQGEIFKRASLSKGELDELVIITGISRERYQREPEAVQQELGGALFALALYRKNDHRPRLGELHLSAQRGISLFTFEEAIAIHLGTGHREELGERLEAFDAAWSALDQRQVASVRSVRIADRSPADRVTIAFAGN